MPASPVQYQARVPQLLTSCRGAGAAWWLARATPAPGVLTSHRRFCWDPRRQRWQLSSLLFRFSWYSQRGQRKKGVKYTRWRIYPGDSPDVSSPAIHPWGRRVLSFPAGQDSGRHSSGVHPGAFLQRAAGSGKGLNGPFCSPTSPRKAAQDPNLCSYILLPD